MSLFWLFLSCYVLGHISFGLAVARLWRLPSLRLRGSGNIGATNVWRLGGWGPAVLTLLGDALKGYAAVRLAFQLSPSSLGISIASIAVTLGHIYPVGYRFKGGKGVATCFGVFMAWSPLLASGLLGFWALVLLISRTSSIATLATALLAPIFASLLMDTYFAGLALILATLIVLSHKQNIARLVKKEEPSL